MHIEHVALWCRDLEAMQQFYALHFGLVAGPCYENSAKGFRSYFLRAESGARLELMHRTGLPDRGDDVKRGWAHLAFSVGSEEGVRAKTEAMRQAGVRVTSDPRWTGDGYYESVIEDPEGNLIEITI